MAAEPTKYPEWASDPPAGPPDTITEPTEIEKDEGWQAVQPRRQYMNWLQNLAYLWVRFLSFVRFRWSDIGPDWHVPDTATSPTTGAGLTGTSGAVTAYIEGRRVAGVSEAHLYAASQDTYVDLSRDAVWTFVQVANGAGEPALTANSIRVFKVVTNGADRTTVTSYVGTQVKTSKSWLFGRAIELGSDFLSAAADAQLSRLATKYRNNADTVYTLLWTIAPATGGHGAVRLYLHSPSQASSAKRYLVITVNGLYFHSGTSWAADEVAAQAIKYVFGASSGNRGSIETYATAGSVGTWLDNAWTTGPELWTTALFTVTLTLTGALAAASAAITGAITAASATLSGALTAATGAFSGNVTIGGDLTISDDLSIVDSVTVGGSLAVTGVSSAVTGQFTNLVGIFSDLNAAQADSYAFSATETFIRSLPLTAFVQANTLFAGEWRYVFPVTATGVRALTHAAAAGAAAIECPLDLPNGVVLTRVTMNGAFDNNGGTISAAVVRVPISGGSTEIMHSAVTDMGNGGVAGNKEIDITINNTIDNNTYSYLIWFYTATQGIISMVRGPEIAFTTTLVRM